MSSVDLADVERRDDRDVLLGSQCSDCGAASFPARDRCPECRSRDVAELAFDDEAVVESHTEIHTPGGPFEPPYVGSFVRLSPGDVRAFAPVFDASPEDLSVGTTVEFAVGETTDGDPIWGVQPAGGDR